jgi:hypothetical protein
MKWAYGVLTCPQRMNTLLRRTLTSLHRGGFEYPHVFADGVSHADAVSLSDALGSRLSVRHPAVMVSGHWVLSAHELLIRYHRAERFALFQDDMVCVRGLREYLERAPHPPRGYCNLYTFPSNQSFCPRDDSGRPRVGWFKSRPVDGNNPTFQTGRGAVALVFSREALVTLLSSRSLVEKCLASEERTRLKRIDGGIVNAMNLAGWSEYVHHPSLVQHTGVLSTVGNNPHPEAESFPGEDSSALDLLD